MPSSTGENSPTLFHHVTCLYNQPYLSGHAFGVACCIYDTMYMSVLRPKQRRYGLAQIALRQKGFLFCAVDHAIAYQRVWTTCLLERRVITSNFHRTALRYGCRPSRFRAVTSLTRSGYKCCSKARLWQEWPVDFQLLSTWSRTVLQSSLSFCHCGRYHDAVF